MIQHLVAALIAGLGFGANAVVPAQSSSAVAQTEQVRAELVAHAPNGARPGSEVWLALKIAHQPHWHTYWKNPGDSDRKSVV